VPKSVAFDGELKLIKPDAAAIDVGSRSHWVAVNPQRDRDAVREFGAFTMDLMRLAGHRNCDFGNYFCGEALGG
jgi:hypothetical protein